MTNTLASIYTTGTTGFTGFVDGMIGLGVAVTLALVAFALINKFLPKKKKLA